MSSTEGEAQQPETTTSTNEAEGRKNGRLKNEKLAAYRQSLSNSSAYAGHLSSMVYGKIKSLWSAQATTFNLGLNQFAGRTFISL